MAITARRVLQPSALSATAQEKRRFEVVRGVAARTEAETARERIAAILGEMGAMVWEAETPEHRDFSFVSDYAETMLGYSHDRWLEKGFWDKIVHPDDRDRAERFFQLAANNEETCECEYRMRAADGHVVHVRDIVWVAAPPSVTCCRGVIEDVTTRKSAEGNASAACEFAKNLFETTSAMIVGLDADGRVRIFNRAAEEVTGYSREELEGRNWLEIVVPRDRYPDVWEKFERLVRDGLPLSLEYPVLTKAGEERYVSWHSTEQHELGLVVGAISIGVDVTESKRVEEELRLSRDHLNRVQAAAGIGVFDLDFSTGITTQSAQLERLYGLPPGGFGVTHEDWLMRVHPDDADRVDKEIKRAIEERTDSRDEFRIVRPDGEIRWMEGRGRPYYDDAGTPLRFAGVSLDVTARKATEEALRESEERFRRLVENAPDVIFRARLLPEVAIEFVSSAVKDLGGYEPEEFYADPSLFWRLVHPDDRELLEGSLRPPTTDTTVLRWRHKDGGTIWSEIRSALVRDESGEVIALEGILRDITLQKKAEEERALLQAAFLGAQKLAAVGTLAGGVAHNFNNLLTAISGYAELVLAKLPNDSDLRADIQEIKRATVRATEVTRGLLDFSRRQTGEFVILDLNEIVSDMQALLEQMIGEDIECVSVLKPDLAAVEGDRSQIEQVIVNMALNARDAIPEGGKLVIETANLDLAEPLIASGVSLDAGRYVTLTICDNGSGMDEETRARVFEPFFTTKDPDRGTGLGLSSAFGIVEAAGGRILVDSRPGDGTTFTIYLPVSDGSPSEHASCSD